MRRTISKSINTIAPPASSPSSAIATSAWSIVDTSSSISAGASIRAVKGIVLRRATDADAEATADLFITSRSEALPSVHFPYPDDSVRRYVRDVLIDKTEGWLAQDGDRIVAVMSLTPGWIDQLYVATDRQGQGIGRRLLDLAKERSDGDLELWTFQVNDRARRFYERNGFTIAEMTDGSGNQEREPDVRYVWHGSVTDPSGG